MEKKRIRRCGISLLEVIACAGIMSLMSFPIVGLLRASIQSWDDHALQESGPAAAIDTARWAVDHIRSCSSVTKVTKNQLDLINQAGKPESLLIKKGQFVLVASGQETMISASISGIKFSELRGGKPNRSRGVEIELTPVAVNTKTKPQPITVRALFEWANQ